MSIETVANNTKNIVLFFFRRDLRIQDNIGFHEALTFCKKHNKLL